jgi:hypothetical protein
VGGFAEPAWLGVRSARRIAESAIFFPDARPGTAGCARLFTGWE